MNDFAPTAKVITDSISTETGHRLTTLELNLHPHTLPQLLAHRAFSRTVNTDAKITFHAHANAVHQQHVYPALWTRDNGSTSAATPLHHTRVNQAREAWDSARTSALNHSRALADLGVHQSIVNRLLTPFAAVTATVTATDWDDFFTQRLAVPNPADPLVDTEITGLAVAIRDALGTSQPEKLQIGHWHLPRLNAFETTHLELARAIHVSAVRCLNGTTSGDGYNDRATYRQLFNTNPPHWSPLEHIATPAATTERVQGNFSGWHQLRHHNPGRFA